MSGKSIHHKEIQYGFEYGSASITRLMSDERKGWVVVELKTPKYRKHGITIYITKTGKVRIWIKGKELKWK